MRIEEGKFYRTRDGRKVGPARRVYDSKAELDGSHSHCHEMDGTYLGDNPGLDLISEWTEGPVVTETVQRIEPGVYGLLKVGAEISIPDCDRPDQPPPREIEAYLTKSCLDASDWRELARVALEIAEYLENVD